MDEAQFRDLYQDSFDRLVGQLGTMTGSFTEAQDCVQEAFVRAWDHHRRLRSTPQAEAWVRTTAYRLFVSRWRRGKLASRASDRSVAPNPPREPGPERIAVVQALQKLPVDQRQALVLYHLADLSVAEIATEIRVPVGTVKARLSRGRGALAVHLADTTTPEEIQHA